jgi:hypothetical protein
MDIFKIKKSDNKPPIAATLSYANGTAVDLTGAGSVWFYMGNYGDYSNYSSGLCLITGSSAGTVQYNWNTADTGSVGTYWGEFRVQWTGSQITLPADHSLMIQVNEDYK